MHQVIVDGLEEYLSGKLKRNEREPFEEHLAICPECRTMVEEMRLQAGWFASLRADPAETPPFSPGFYARLSERLDQQEHSVWMLFFQPAVARRLALACLLLLAALGTVVVSREPEFATAPSPEMVLADDGQDWMSDPQTGGFRDRMLLTLVSYE